MSTIHEGEQESECHILSQRKALQYCLNIIKSSGYIPENTTLDVPWFAAKTSSLHPDWNDSWHPTVIPYASERLHSTSSTELLTPWDAASNLQHVRHDALQRMIDRLRQSCTVSDDASWQQYNYNHQSIIDVVNWNDDDGITVLSLKHKFIYRNIPCIVKGLDKHEYLNIAKLWTRRQGESNSNSTNERIHSQINTEWFLTQLGEDCLVPIRHNVANIESPIQSSIDTQLDLEGRANECLTTIASLKQWVYLLQSKQYSNMNSPNDEDPNIYLKDWHLQQQWESSHQKQALFYMTPEIFQHDLLNDYLIKFTSGDYRFVYWGPIGSRTNLHSDVMNSLSWSYNVCGEKEWTFYIPKNYDTTSINHRQSFKVTQLSGDCLFVPAGWKHEVQNLVETVSINHNWVVPASLDLTWKCMLDEIEAVEKEMTSWGMESFEIRERMLLGCFGLDVSSLFLMILVGMIHQMKKLDLLPKDSNEKPSFDAIRPDSWELWFDLGCMISIGNTILIDSSTKHVVDLPRRLEATLGDKTMASNALQSYYFLRSTCFEYYGLYTQGQRI